MGIETLIEDGRIKPELGVTYMVSETIDITRPEDYEAVPVRSDGGRQIYEIRKLSSES